MRCSVDGDNFAQLAGVDGVVDFRGQVFDLHVFHFFENDVGVVVYRYKFGNSGFVHGIVDASRNVLHGNGCQFLQNRVARAFVNSFVKLGFGRIGERIVSKEHAVFAHEKRSFFRFVRRSFRLEHVAVYDHCFGKKHLIDDVFHTIGHFAHLDVRKICQSGVGRRRHKVISCARQSVFIFDHNVNLAVRFHDFVGAFVGFAGLLFGVKGGEDNVFAKLVRRKFASDFDVDKFPEIGVVDCNVNRIGHIFDFHRGNLFDDCVGGAVVSEFVENGCSRVVGVGRIVSDIHVVIQNVVVHFVCLGRNRAKFCKHVAVDVHNLVEAHFVDDGACRGGKVGNLGVLKRNENGVGGFHGLTIKNGAFGVAVVGDAPVFGVGHFDERSVRRFGFGRVCYAHNLKGACKHAREVAGRGRT